MASITRGGIRLLQIGGASLLAVAMASAAQAQEQAQSSDVGAAIAPDEIIVTAQRRAQNILDVGISISVANANQISEQRIDTVNDIIEVSPNITVKDNVPGLVPVLTIRGVGLNDFSATNNPSAGVYVDEVSLSSLALMNFDFFDLERIEVLKGPQGTLYGRTSTAGALNISTATPELGETSGRLALGIGNYESRNVEAMVNVPVSDTLALRIAGRAILQEEGFYFDRTLGRDIGRRDQWMGRTQAYWEPSDTVDVTLKVEGNRARSELGGPEFFGAFRAPMTPAGVDCPGSPECSDFFGYTDNDGDPFKGDWSVNPRYTLDQMMYTGRVNVDLGFGTLSSVTGYIDFDRRWSVDTDGTRLAQLDFVTEDSVKQFSQELRLSGDSGILNWTVGGFYSNDDIQTSYAGNFAALFNTTTYTFSDQTSKSAALFANGEWKLTDTLNLVTGLRYTSESRTNLGGTSDLVSLAPGSALSSAPLGSPPIPLAVSDNRISDKNWSWRLGLNWTPSDSMLVYASASQGIKSGGFFAGVATTSAQLVPYRPERLRSYELGARGRLRDAGFSYSASVFYYDYNDVQTFIRDTAGNLPIQRLGNVDSAGIYGFDAELSYAPAALEGLNLQLGLGLLDTKLGTFAASAGPIAAGNRMPDAPTLTLGAGAAYKFAVSGDISARLAFNGRYQSSAFKDAINDPLLEVPGYWLLSGRASLMHSDGWDLSVWGENLNGKRYVTQGVNNLSLGVGFRVYGAPRTFGISMSKTF